MPTVARPTAPRPRSRRLRALLALVLGLAVLSGLLGGCAAAGGATSTSSAPATDGAVTGSAELAPAEATTNLPVVRVDRLPPEAVDTLVLIEAGGPFPYDKDGSVFGNREGLLPPQPNGFYREYTVVTPGSSDRGARRIVGGDDGSRFWTEDHYASFEEIVQ
ncbi:MAG: ribonuclease domain-containing protein [Candidatus Nanopelagicales bacterium]